MKNSPIIIGDGLCLCGAFQMADTYGFPLWAFMDRAKMYGLKTSFPHYFASAIEHGWDDIQTFSKIKEALEDCGLGKDFEDIKMKCIFMFMQYAKSNKGCTTIQIATAMRVDLETVKEEP